MLIQPKPKETRSYHVWRTFSYLCSINLHCWSFIPSTKGVFPLWYLLITIWRAPKQTEAETAAHILCWQLRPCFKVCCWHQQPVTQKVLSSLYTQNMATKPSKTLSKQISNPSRVVLISFSVSQLLILGFLTTMHSRVLSTQRRGLAFHLNVSWAGCTLSSSSHCKSSVGQAASKMSSMLSLGLLLYLSSYFGVYLRTVLIFLCFFYAQVSLAEVQVDDGGARLAFAFKTADQPPPPFHFRPSNWGSR